ncbi:PAS domain-containing sensor histidine kinase [Devosia sp. A16]|uniref:PAS domain-containing sensor histidine kinase n=1 Tax=Devosia sp. A16 TaxID=1736675 RepID=UPI000AC8B5CA|nr:PAS domain-containing protein [Devosia sp. A16]
MLLANSFDWSATELGPIAEWPVALRSAARLIMTAAAPMALLIGPNGVMLYNSAYAPIAGGRHPGAFGSSVLESWPEVAEFNRDVLRRVLGGESLVFNSQPFVFYRNGGPEKVWLNLDYSPVLDDDGSGLAVLAIVQETTAGVVAEQALEESREKLDLALTASGMVGTWDWNISDNVVTADDRFAALYGVTPGSAAVGLPIETFLDGVHPDDRQRVIAEIGDALKRPGPVRLEYRLSARGGAPERWVVASGRVIADVNGKAIRLPGVVVDVTEERRVAEQLAESELRFRTLADTMPQMVWSTLPDGFHDYYNARWYEFTGVPQGSTDGEGWNGMFHPDDQERAWAVWRHSLATGDPYRIEYRLKHHSGAYRWVLGQALPIRDASGRITRWFGTCTDIHEERLAQEEREVIAQELSHRIKNIFAVIGGIVSLAARSQPEAKDFADRLRGRILALGRAHDFVRPHSRESLPRSNPASLQALVRSLLQPYRDGEIERVSFTGDDAVIDDGAATPLALLFHELATNAAKYGALSRGDGRIEITTQISGESYLLHWREIGGPSPKPGAAGFGSRLISLSVEGQLRGKLERRYDETGLEVNLSVPLAALRRSAELRPAPEFRQ